jgi:hypothetical protein
MMCSANLYILVCMYVCGSVIWHVSGYELSNPLTDTNQIWGIN